MLWPTFIGVWLVLAVLLFATLRRPLLTATAHFPAAVTHAINAVASLGIGYLLTAVAIAIAVRQF